jgi:4-hydroxybenzoate polyprenyltransferase
MSFKQRTIGLSGLNVKVKLADWLRTTRVQTAMVTALTLWIGYITVSPISIRSAVILGCIGLLVHVWGFTLNEVEDYRYDAKHGDVTGHPIAKGKVEPSIARYIAWVAGFAAVGMSSLFSYNTLATVVLISSFIPGYAYNKWSKTHWWSNAYLSLWASAMVVAGALYAGQPNYYTAAIAAAVGIQIFVQVIEGDLKDLMGPESSFVKKMGVKTADIVGSLYDPTESTVERGKKNVSQCKVIEYCNSFTSGVYVTKAVEVGLLFFVLSQTVPMGANAPVPYMIIFMAAVIAFFYTLSMFMVYEFDRDQIKRMASAHELVSIVVLGIAVVGLDPRGAILVVAVPILWYLSVNHTIHSSAINPDI